MTLRDLQPQADGFVKALGEALEPSADTTAFWRFFSLDVPTPVLSAMTMDEGGSANLRPSEGWWYDALRLRPDGGPTATAAAPGSSQFRVLQLLATNQAESVSLYEWSDHVLRWSEEAVYRGTSDPRTGEWTALEIVRQVAHRLSDEQGVEAYLGSPAATAGGLVCVHPANLRVPQQWLPDAERSWLQWRELVIDQKIIFVSESEQIVDRRYTPLLESHPLFREIDPVRGLGLLLYGLLKRSFDLPAAWNGPGHATILAMLPRLLLADMTCSSWTLGVLLGCLNSRTTENLVLRRQNKLRFALDDDTLRDPVLFLNASDVERALGICQDKLRMYQLSTIRERARQLTPIRVRQLTEPDWAKVFPPFQAGDDEIHD
jgi:hypothetical protein